MNELAVFDEVAATIAEYKVESDKLVFDYADKDGAKQARSHISKLRKVKGKIGEVHKEAKAEALAFGRKLDAKKNEYIGEVDKMIKVHKDPLDVIEAEVIAESLKRQQEKADAEAKRIADIEARERAIILAEEKIAREKTEAEEKIAREKAKAEEKIRKEKAVEAERVMKEQQEKIALIEEEKRIAEEKAEKLRLQVEEKAKAEAMAAKAKELAEREAEEERLADIAAEKAIEAKRIADKEHRQKVENEIHKAFTDIGYTSGIASDILGDLIENKIPHVTINY